MGLFDKLKKGLTKTRDKVGTGFRAVLRVGQSIDEEVIERLEETMLSDDMGPGMTGRLIEDVRSAWKRGQLKEAQEITPFLQERIIGYWPENVRLLISAE